MVSDSTSSVIVPRNGVDPRQLTMQLGPVWIAEPSHYRAFISDTRAVALEADGQVLQRAFAVQHPEWSLLAQLQPLSFLPSNALTAPLGHAHVDTSVFQRRLPSGLWNDTTIVRWSNPHPSSPRRALSRIPNGSPRNQTAVEYEMELSPSRWIRRGRCSR